MRGGNYQAPEFLALSGKVAFYCGWVTVLGLVAVFVLAMRRHSATLLAVRLAGAGCAAVAGAASGFVFSWPSELSHFGMGIGYPLLLVGCLAAVPLGSLASGGSVWAAFKGLFSGVSSYLPAVPGVGQVSSLTSQVSSAVRDSKSAATSAAPSAQEAASPARTPSCPHCGAATRWVQDMGRGYCDRCNQMV